MSRSVGYISQAWTSPRYSVSTFWQFTQLRVCPLFSFPAADISNLFDGNSGRFYFLSLCQLLATLFFLPGFVMRFLFNKQHSHSKFITYTYPLASEVSFLGGQNQEYGSSCATPSSQECWRGLYSYLRDISYPHDSLQHLFACVPYYSKYTMTSFTIIEVEAGKAAAMPHSIIFQSIEFLLPNREIFPSISSQYWRMSSLYQ